jgi:hypothetical protein
MGKSISITREEHQMPDEDSETGETGCSEMMAVVLMVYSNSSVGCCKRAHTTPHFITLSQRNEGISKASQECD